MSELVATITTTALIRCRVLCAPQLEEDLQIGKAPLQLGCKKAQTRTRNAVW